MSSTYLINDIPRGITSNVLISFLAALVNGSATTDTQLEQFIKNQLTRSSTKDPLTEFQALVHSADVTDSRLDDELSVAVIQFQDTPKWFKDRDYDPYGFPKKTKLGTIWKGVDMVKKDNNGQTAFIRAVIDGNLKLAETLAEFEGTDVNAKDNKGMTALHWACKEGLTDLTAFCLSIPGLDISVRSNAGLTAFDIAYREALRDENDAIPTLFYKSMFEMDKYDPDSALLRLLTLTAESGCRTKFPQEALFNPARNGNLALVKALIQNITFTNAVARNRDKDTALHLAVKGGHTAVVAALVEAGFNINATAGNGHTALHYATRYGHTEIIHSLISHGADIEAVESFGRTPLHIAVENGHESPVRALVERGANLESRDKEGRTPLYISFMTGLEICQMISQFLVARGADIEAVDNKGQTPRMIAEANKHQNIFPSLMVQPTMTPESQFKSPSLHGIAQSSPSQQSLPSIQKTSTPYNNTISSPSPQSTQRHPILQSSTPINTTSPQKSSTQKEGEMKLIKLLQERGGDINGKDKEGRAALHIAAYQEDTVVLRLLLDRGANIEEKLFTWKTALEIAEENNNEEVVKLLLDRGAKTTAENSRERAEKLRPPYSAAEVKENVVVPQSPYLEVNVGSYQEIKVDSIEIPESLEADQEFEPEVPWGSGASTDLLEDHGASQESKLDLIPQEVVGVGLQLYQEFSKEAEDDNKLAIPQWQDVPNRAKSDISAPPSRRSTPEYRGYQGAMSPAPDQGSDDENYGGEKWTSSRSSTPEYKGYQPRSPVFDQSYGEDDYY